jgi:hypothetical protein
LCIGFVIDLYSPIGIWNDRVEMLTIVVVNTQ